MGGSVLLLALFGWSLYLAIGGGNPGDPQLFAAITTALYGKEEVSFGLPMRLKIPAINIDTDFEYVGLAKNGIMDIPKGPMTAAWFNLGPRPGERGSAIISGHSGWKNNTPAIFDDLHTLQKGDHIYIEDEKGMVVTFVVRELRTYAQDEKAPEVFGSSDGEAHLNLVTCEGVWNEAEKNYSDRLVVFTDKEEG